MFVRTACSMVELSDRDVQIVWAWSTGRPNEWLAGLLAMNVDTLKYQQRALLRKLGVQSKTQAVAVVLRAVLRWAEPQPSARRDAPPETRIRVRIEDAAIRAIKDGADPVLTLSYLVWPSEAVAAALAA